MKKLRKPIALLLFITLLITLTAVKTNAASGDIVTFDSPLVKRAVNKTLGVSNLDADITEGQLGKLTSLVIDEEGAVTSFKGLEKAYNLNRLDIGKTTDLYNESSATEVTTTDYTPLAGTKIRTFRMFSGKSGLTSLAPLLNMPQIQVLTLNTNNTSDFEALKSMPQITHLYLYGVRDKQSTVDPSVFQNINPSILSLSYINFTSTFNFSHMTKLTDITIAYSNLTDISTIPANALINNVNFNFNKELTDVSHLADIDAVTMINVAGTNVSDISFIKDMNVAKLQAIYLQQNKIVDVSVFAGLSMPSLWSLELSNNQIKDISAFRTFDSRLDTTVNDYFPRGLYLRGNQITDFTPLAKYVGKRAQVIATSQIVTLPDAKVGENVEMPFTDAEGNPLTYHNANTINSLVATGNTYGNFTADGNAIKWDEITPTDNPKYNRLYGGNHDPNSTAIAPVGQVLVGMHIFQNVTPQTYTLTFDGNTTDDVMNLPASLEQEASDSIIIPTETPERNDHTFVGWNTKADGSGETYASGSEITLTEDMTLYAMWEVNIANPVEKPTENPDEVITNTENENESQGEGRSETETETGDYSQATLYMILLALSGITIFFVEKKKNH